MKITAKAEATGIAAKPTAAARALAAELGPRVAARVEAVKTALRNDTRAGLGGRLANTWRADVYPVSRPTRSLNPAGYVYSAAPEIAGAFDPGTVIRAVSGRYLAIPTENVPKGGRSARGRFSGRLRPADVEQRFNQGLEPVPSLTRPGVILLVLRGTVGPRGFRANRAKSDAGRAKAPRVVMFVLVPMVRLGKRLNHRAIMSRGQRDFQADIAAGVKIALLKAEA